MHKNVILYRHKRALALPHEVRRALSPHVCEHCGAHARTLANASHAARKRHFNQHALERWGTYQKSIKTLWGDFLSFFSYLRACQSHLILEFESWMCIATPRLRQHSLATHWAHWSENQIINLRMLLVTGFFVKSSWEVHWIIMFQTDLVCKVSLYG